MMNLPKLAAYVWEFGQLALSARDGLNGEFHKKRMVVTGHWRYLGHDLRRKEGYDNSWCIPGHPLRKHFYYRTMRDCCEELFEEYLTMLWTAITIEEENEERKNTG